MNTLAFDTATSATVVGLSVEDQPVLELRVDTDPAGRPRHTAELLMLAETLLTQAGITFSDLDRVGVGVGPGSYTGVRVAISTAYGLAQSLDVELAAIDTLAGVGLGVETEKLLIATTDARRGQIFAQAFHAGEPVTEPLVADPMAAVSSLCNGEAALAIGEGASAYRAILEGVIELPPEPECKSALTGSSLCRLAKKAAPTSLDRLLPLYLREPDVKKSD